MLWDAWVKIAKGSERANHKYIRRVPRPGGGYSYVYGEGASVHHSAAKHDPSLKHFASVTSSGGSGSTTLDQLKGEKMAALRDALVSNPREPVHIGGYEVTLVSAGKNAKGESSGIVQVRKHQAGADVSDAVSRLRGRIARHKPEDDPHWGHVGDLVSALHHVDAASGDSKTGVDEIRGMRAKDAYGHVLKKLNERINDVHGSDMANKVKHLNRALDPHAD